MLCRRSVRQFLNTRISLRTAVLSVLILMTLHLCILYLVRNVSPGGSTSPAKVAAWRRRELPMMTSEKLPAVETVRRTPPTKREQERSRTIVDVGKIRRRLSDEDGNKDGGDSDSAAAAPIKTRRDNNSEVFGQTVEVERREDMTKDGKNPTQQEERCIRYISAYTPRMQPFHYWREYVNLEAAFKAATLPNSSYYSSRVQQHREFPTMFIRCPGYQCDVALRPTADENFLARSDAVIINIAPQEVRYKMPRISERLVETLPRRVKIFFYAMESPLMMNYWDHTIQDIMYHYTMTYHSDSDVHLPYGRYVPGEPTDTEDINFAENKTSLLVWTASNCNNTFWPRYEWVAELQKRLPFDTYGRCGTKTCLPPLSPKCTQEQSVYKFYLALENAPCDEYISEKFWVNSLLNGVVPIIYGGKREMYERVAPPNSFIHVSDFATQEGLVAYLKMVDKNDNLYNEYFAWRKKGRVENIYPDLYPEAFCRVLPKLSLYSNPPVKTIKDSTYFQSCRGGHRRNFTKSGDINNWEPWR